MADREPRRRKKRKDSAKKDEHHSDEASTMPFHKVEPRDSDQDAEDDFPPPPSHQPSQLAQIVFMIFFLALAGLMACVFIALHGSNSHLQNFNGEEEHADIQPLSDLEIDTADLHEKEDEHEEELIDILEKFQELAKDFTSDTKEKIPEQSQEEEEEEEEEVEEEIVYSEPIDIQSVTEDHLENSILPSEDIASDSGIDDTSDLPDDDDDELDSDGGPVFDEMVSEPIEPATEIPVTLTLEPSVDARTTDETSPDDEMATDDVEDDNEELENPLEIEEPEGIKTDEYENADITNEEDYAIKDELDDIDKIIDKSANIALQKFEAILKVHPSSPRVLYGKSRALDALANSKRSNKILEEAISAFQDVMNAKNVPDKLFLLAANRCVERMQFRGFMGKSIKVLLQMAARFPNDIDIKNKIAVGYLLIGRNQEAKKAFMETLKEAPDNGFAKVHLGFILKTDESKYEEAIKLMSEGIESREPGVIDGRFYLHLGDALARTNRETEAMKVYEDGVKEGVFLSAFQRSLYNVKGLTGKPWWEPLKTTYSTYFKILEKNWLAIRNEAQALIAKNVQGFAPESEGLQDKGDWKQFELFARGRKIPNNCNQAPFTCSLIEQIPDASTCKRGQAKFSIMKAGTHVWAHNGPTNCRLRAHLGLITPPGASIRVANETRTWNEGKIILFDDSFEHEVWHRGTKDRLVLIVDFWHPELTSHQKSSLSPI